MGKVFQAGKLPDMASVYHIWRKKAWECGKIPKKTLLKYCRSLVLSIVLRCGFYYNKSADQTAGPSPASAHFLSFLADRALRPGRGALLPRERGSTGQIGPAGEEPGPTFWTHFLEKIVTTQGVWYNNQVDHVPRRRVSVRPCSFLGSRPAGR
jgi:hypothetical protein